MPKLAVQVPHALGRDEATQRLKRQLDELTSQGELPVSDLAHQWQDHTLSIGFQVMGMKVAGAVTVEDERVCVDAELPWAAMMVKGMIEQRLRDELGQVLA
jgi:hypothetical protein